jgi:hypothetical protein
MGGFNYGSIINEAWGWPDDSVGLIASFAGAANITIGANPPYSVANFLAMYPKFLGTPLSITMAVTSGSPNATLPVADARLLAGQLVTGADIPAGTTIQSINGTAVVLSANATATNGTEATQVYAFALISVAVLNVFINLASASVMQARWQDGWLLGMALFIAHYATLWLRSDGTPAVNGEMAAQQAMRAGIQVSKTVGDTNTTYQPVQGIEDWGAWNTTMYGMQFATMARVVGAGSMLIW